MTGSALILLREGLEAALIVAIVLAYLRRLGRRDQFRAVWAGAGVAALLAVVVGVILFATVGDLTGDARTLTFAIIMLSAAAILTWMVFWMRGQARALKGELHEKVDSALLSGSLVALAAVVFFGVLREGIETVLFFLAAAGNSSTADSLIGGTLGLLVAIGLAYAFYRGASWLNLRQFFTVSGALVLLVAAGLLSRSVAEFQVLGTIPTFWFPVFDVSSVTGLSADSFSGKLLRGLFGWDPAPSIEEIGVWIAYVGVVGTLYFRGLVRLPAWRRRRSSEVAAATPPGAAAEAVDA